MKVSDVMTSEVQLCTPDDTLKDAAQAMGVPLVRAKLLAFACGASLRIRA